MYKDKFVVVVKYNGAILRENNDGYVTLPFNSEYSLLLKNLDSRRSIVRISIDGDDILDNSQIIINGNSQLELEGFMKDSVVKNKFKFIKKTENIVSHRGDKLDDGIIRVEYQFEKYQDELVTIHHNHVTYHWYNWYDNWYWHHPYKYYHKYPIIRYDGSTNGSLVEGTTDNISCNTYNVSDTLNIPKINQDEGITVHGSVTNQQFTPSYINDIEENSHVIILKLCGTTSQGKKISGPITVNTKLVCPTCGTKSKSDAKFCSECSTALIV